MHHDPDYHLFSACNYALQKIDQPTAIASLIDASQHPDPKIRFDAVIRLGSLVDPETTVALLERLDDSDEQVRSRSIYELSSRRFPDLTKKLLKLLATDPSPSVRNAACYQLRYTQEAFDPLITALKDSSGLVRTVAAEGLMKFKNPVSVQALITTFLADDNPSVRGACARF
jgi:HEAT repeat protein